MNIGAAPLVGLIPTALLAAGDAMAGDPWALVTQLGVGGVLVGFAVWLQDKFATASRKDLTELRKEMTALCERHDGDMRHERDRHDKTREQLYQVLAARQENRP